MKKRLNDDGVGNALIQGAAIAAAIVAKGDYGDGLVKQILNAFVGGWGDLKRAKVDAYDMKILRKYLRDSNWGKSAPVPEEKP